MVYQQLQVRSALRCEWPAADRLVHARNRVGRQRIEDDQSVGPGLLIRDTARGYAQDKLMPRVRLFAQFDGDIASNARSFAGTTGVKLTW